MVATPKVIWLHNVQDGIPGYINLSADFISPFLISSIHRRHKDELTT